MFFLVQRFNAFYNLFNIMYNNLACEN